MSEFELPEGWEKSTLGSLTTIMSGIGFPKEYQGQTDGDIPFVKVGDISRAVQLQNKHISHAENYVSFDTGRKLKGKLIPKGSTIFAKIGEAIKLNRRAFVQREILIDNNVMAVTASDNLSDRYLFYFMNTISFTEQSRSTTVPSLRKDDVESIEAPLPPLAEQREIAARLDGLLAQVDSIKGRLDGVPALLKRFRQAVLAAAVSGRLTNSQQYESKQISEGI